ncbi:hypothetical protein [Vibrio cyclitrophicus]
MKSTIAVVTFFALVATIVYAIFAILAFSGAPVNILERFKKEEFDSSFSLRNLSNKEVSIADLTLQPDALIDLRSLGGRLFVRWSDGVFKAGKSIQASSALKTEHSIYGKYSIEVGLTQWNTLFSAPISEQECHRYIIKWFHPMPHSGIVLSMRDEDSASFYQNIHYAQRSPNMYELEVEENYKRYFATGSHFYYRYYCGSSGKLDRLTAFVAIISQLIN